MADRLPPPARRSSRAAVLVVVVVSVLLACPTVAGADDVSSAEFQRRLDQALADPDAAAALRRVDRVGGRTVDLERALAGASGEQLEARLRALRTAAAAPPGGPVPSGGSPRDEARRILDERRFHPGAVPRPFRSLFRTLGRWLRPVTRPIARAWSALSDNGFALAALSAAVVLLAAVVSARLGRRRSAAGVLRAGRAGAAGRHDDPDELERRATDAERAGDLALALRLRFRAGVERLDRAGVVVARPALTTGALTRQLPSARLHALADAFEEVAYGGRPASADDVAAARSGWPRVLEEVAR